MRGLRNLVTLAGKELVVLGRDRQAAALLFGMPAVFVLFLSLALEQVYGEKMGVQLGVVLEVEDHGELGREIAERLREEGGFRMLLRPPGVPNAELFRSGTSAAVRIPAGFSADAEAFVRASCTGEFGPNRIQWEASPALDAAYRWLLEARLATTCMAVLQEELGEGQKELGEQLEKMGDELTAMGEKLESMGTELESMGAKLEETGSLLESTAAELQTTVELLERASALLGGTVEELETAARAAIAEQAASAEAASVRSMLAARGDLPEGVSLEEPPLPELSFERPVRASERAAAGAQPLTETQRNEGGEELATPAATPVADEAEIAASAELFLSERAGPRNVLPTPLQQTVPGWSLFAMFFIVVPLSHGLHRERAEGTLRRILALAVPQGAFVLGKVVPYVLVGVLQFAGMLAVGLYVVPLVSDLSLELGARPLVLLPITLACALAATSYGLLVATLARTPEQAAALGSTSVIVLAVIGGVMVPHFAMPELLQKLALASPLYWGHKAYLDAFLHGAGLAEVSRSLFVLVAFALVCLAVSARRVARY